MKKIVFVDIPMQKKEKLNYKGTGNVHCSYAADVLYPVTAFLSESVREGDIVKVVLLKTDTGDARMDSQTKENARIFEDELDEALAPFHIQAEYTSLHSPFDESKENHEARFRKMLDELDEGAELYADITFGPRLVPMLLLCVFNFAERFFDCRVKGMVYGKALFDENNRAYGGELYDVSPLYYLNSLTNSMESLSIFAVRWQPWLF